MKVMPSQKNTKKIIRISQNSPGCVKKIVIFRRKATNTLHFTDRLGGSFVFFLKIQAELYVLENINEE